LSRKRALSFIAILLGLGACGGTPRPAVVTAPRSTTSAADERIAAQASTIRELEGRLALAQGEARDLRSEMERAVRPTEPVTIGRESRADDWHEPDEWEGEEIDAEREEPVEEPPVEPEEEERPGPRPVLRLYGVRQPGDLDPMPMLPPMTGGERLPVMGSAPLLAETGVPFGIPTPRPSESVAPPPFVHREPSAPPFIQSSAPASDDVRDRYRSALRAFRDRQFRAALDLLDRIVEEHGDHSLAGGARYWRAEALYSLGAYARARPAFESVLRENPRGENAAQVLLKIGLCHMRLGSRAEARRYFDRLRTEYPSSPAVRLIEEGST
jgi:tol-pal system protein YbgF